MRPLARYRRTPPSASGRSRHDVPLSVADAAVSALLATSARRRIAPPGGTERTMALTVARRRVVALDEDVVELTLTPGPGDSLPRWYPGAHLDLHLPSDRVRQYSLCGDPQSRSDYRVAVRRIPGGGGGSMEVHDALGEGATVHTHGPRNAFPLTVPGFGSPAGRFRFIAGGIGITPILPMLGLARRLGIEWSMVYTGRSRQALPYLDELRAFGGRVVIRTDDERGLPTAAELLGDCPDGTAVYACGPAPMLTAIRTMNGAVATSSAVPIAPATNEPNAAVASAWAALPALAILLPSMAVTTDELSPGVLSRIDVVEPPYMPP